MSLILKNCALADSSITDILIAEGKIKRLGTGLTADKTIDIHNQLVLPGVIDIHVHFRQPGGEQKETWRTGSQAAVAGGVTTVVDMPNTMPPTTNQATLDMKRGLAAPSLCNYGFHLGATTDNHESLEDVQGIAGIKVYVGSSTGTLLVAADEEIKKLFTIPGRFWMIHAEDEPTIQAHAEALAGHDEPEIHSRVRDRDAAITAVERVISIAQDMDARIHICHLSTAEEVELVRQAKRDGISVSCEVSPHHLFLNETAYEKFGNLVKVNPPLRTKHDNEVLMAALADGTIDIVATDHAPHTLDEKHKAYPDAPSGIPEVQTSLPLLVRAVKQGKITMRRLVEAMATTPAQLLNIKSKGEIKAGFDADLVVVNEQPHLLQKKELYSKAGYSPYEGWELPMPVMTLVNGNVVFDHGTINEQFTGKEITYGTI